MSLLALVALALTGCAADGTADSGATADTGDDTALPWSTEVDIVLDWTEGEDLEAPIELDDGGSVVLAEGWAMTWSVELQPCSAYEDAVTIGHAATTESEARTVKAPVVHDLTDTTQVYMGHAHPMPGEYCGAWPLLSWTNEATPALYVPDGGEVLIDEALSVSLSAERTTSSGKTTPIVATAQTARGGQLAFDDDVVLDLEDGDEGWVVTVRRDRAAALAATDWEADDVGAALQDALLDTTYVELTRRD